MVNPAITNVVIILFFMQASKKVPFDDPNVLNIVRAIYVASNLIIAAIYYYVYTVIKARNDQTTLKYVEPPQMGSEEKKLVSTNNKTYDLNQLTSLAKGSLMGVGMMAVMHLYFKFTNPLLIQSVLPVKSALESNLVKVHVFGQPATGDLKRPWKAAAGFMASLSGGGEIASDKKSVEEAERTIRGGVKDE